MLMAFVAITFSSVAQAQDQHGVSISKGCESPVRICDTDAECDDANQCTDDVCDDTLPNLLDCTFNATNDDDFLDTLSVNGAWDMIFNNGGPTRVPAVGNADIVAVDGNTTCVVGPYVPCTIGPDAGGGPGSVTFVSTGYSPTAADPNPLQDQVTVLIEDLCDGIPTPDCFPGIDNPVSFGAATILADTCISLPVVCDCLADVDCDDGEFCDGAETCDLGTGECIAGTPVDVDDGVGCTDDSCDEVNNVVVNAPNDGLCDNGEFCDGSETCDAVNDCQAGTPPCDPATETCDETGDICEPPGCQSDAECDDGLFCNGTESCDLDTGGCVAVSACPPAIDGCVIRGASCDEDNDMCIDEADDSLCQEGEVCMPPEGPCVVPCDFDPSTQKYWHSQCLALPASEGGIDHKGRGPKRVKEPGFVEVLIPCAEQYLEDVGLFEVTSCEGMDANPPSDDCERAIKQLTALILNVCSDRLPLDCPVCIADTCANALPEGSDVQDLIDGVAGYIIAGMCKEAAELAALANDGEAICVLDP